MKRFLPNKLPYPEHFSGLHQQAEQSSLLFRHITGTVRFIQSKGVDNRLPPTSVGQQGNHHHDQLLCFAQPPKHRPFSCAKRLLTRRAAIARSLSTMDHGMALPFLPSCRTLPVRAKYLGSIHLALCLCFHTRSLPDVCSSFKAPHLPPIRGVPP